MCVIPAVSRLWVGLKNPSSKADTAQGLVSWRKSGDSSKRNLVVKEGHPKLKELLLRSPESYQSICFQIR